MTTGNRIITLITDFGTNDGYAGAMKGVILSINPNATIVDISHDIDPQNILQAAYILDKTYPYFPENTIHIAVVDPGVGTERKAIILKTRQAIFVAPDNGVLSYMAKDKLEVVTITNPRFWLDRVSNTFHGRDIFAPVGAHLAAGIPLAELGTRITDPILLDIPKASQTPQGWDAQITLIDHFGNLRTNLHTSQITGDVNFQILGKIIEGLSKSYGQHTTGDLVAIADSGGYLEIAVVNGSAEKKLGAKFGDLVEVVLNG